MFINPEMGLPASLVSRAVKDSSPALSIQSHVLYVHTVEAPSRLGQGRGASVGAVVAREREKRSIIHMGSAGSSV